MSVSLLRWNWFITQIISSVCGAHKKACDWKLKAEQKNLNGSLTAVNLVGFVLAVGVSVAPPGQPDALPTATAESSGAALRPAAWGRGWPRGSTPAALWPLIRTIRAIRVPVAGPGLRHALRGVAAELVWPTGGR